MPELPEDQESNDSFEPLEPESDLDRLIHSINQLSKAVKSALDRISDTEEIQGKQGNQNRKMRRLLVLGLFSFLLDIGLTAIVFRNYIQVNEVQHRTSSEVFCPLYTLMTDRFNPDLDRDGAISHDELTQWSSQVKDENRDGNISGSEEKNFQSTREAIFNGYDALECKEA